MTRATDTGRPARRELATLAAALLVALLSTLNLAALFYVLYVGAIHPTRPAFIMDRDREGSSTLAVASLTLAVAILVGLCAWAIWRCRRAMIGGDDGRLRTFVRAGLPAVVAVVWVVPVVANTRVALLLLFACTLLVGWAVGRFIRAACAVPARHGGALESPPLLATPNAHWWREGWFAGLAVLTVVLTTFHVYVQVQVHAALQYGSPDIGYYAEMLLNVLRGRGLYCEAFGHHFFGEHFSPGLYLLVPLFACYPHIETLMAIGAAAVLAGSWAVYALARTRGAAGGLSATLATAYLLYPATSRIIYGASYGFHEILLAIPAMLWSFYYFELTRWGRMAACTALALSFKEDVAVVYACFGLYVFARQRRNWWGLVLAAFCVAYFAAVVYWIVPHFNPGGGYSKLYLYDGLGESPLGIATAFFRKPELVLQRLGSWQALSFALTLLVPLALWPLARGVCLAALPTFAFIGLMNTSEFASIRFWHQATILPVVWLATVLAVVHPALNRARQYGRAATLVVCAALLHYALGFSPLSRVWRDLPLENTRERALVEQLHEWIPRSARVQATARLAAHFIEYDRVYPILHRPSPPPDWIVIDLNESFTRAEELSRIETLARDIHQRGEYVLVSQIASTLVFQRR